MNIGDFSDNNKAGECYQTTTKADNEATELLVYMSTTVTNVSSHNRSTVAPAQPSFKGESKCNVARVASF